MKAVSQSSQLETGHNKLPVVSVDVDTSHSSIMLDSVQ